MIALMIPGLNMVSAQRLKQVSIIIFILTWNAAAGVIFLKTGSGMLEQDGRFKGVYKSL